MIKRWAQLVRLERLVKIVTILTPKGKFLTRNGKFPTPIMKHFGLKFGTQNLRHCSIDKLYLADIV